MVKNEKGSTLLMVLLVMSLFTILGLSLIGQNLNNSKQLSKTGNELRATNLAEMGVAHLKEELRAVIKAKAVKSLDSFLKIQIDLGLLSTTPYKIRIADDQYYSVKSGLPIPVLDGQTLIKVNIPFTAVGYSGKYQKTISGNIVLAPNFAVIPAGIDPITGSPYYKTDGEFGDEDTPVYYSDGFSVKASTTQEYKFDLYSQGEITMTSNSDIIVNGNAYVEDLYLTTTGGGLLGGLLGNEANQSLMCVKGTITIFGSIPEGVNLTEVANINCDSIVAENNNSGIYATKIVFQPFWNYSSEVDYK